ncbi:hypothetical protein [uncultured Bacteroides sp.]|uniref:hypothetical protein n=1 Tax=uncultured Bacteroides sp. TaxID=162156 RepID=UPI0027DBB61E|nr:hypothetical protein [uncultured Bacteroides sp.]
MPGLSFYDKQHIQKVAAQQGVINNIFNQFILSISPYLRKWDDAGKNNVWIQNHSIENAVDKELLTLESLLLKNIESFQFDAWKRSDMKNDDFIREYIKGMSISSAVKEGMFTHSMSAFSAFQKEVDAQGLRLSDRVWAITQQTKSQLEFYLNSGVATGRSSNEISRDMRQLLDKPDKRFRRVRNDEGKLVLSRPMKDYHPGQGVYRSAKMNALRTSATTTNTAYRSADYERWSKQDFVLGIEIQRSANNRGPCKICDAMVGKYPKTFKFTGFHPFCICFATPIVMEPDNLADFLLNDTVPQEQVITDIPQGAKDFVSENKDGLQSAFWYKDNFTQDGNVNERLKPKPAVNPVNMKKENKATKPQSEFVSFATPQQAIDFIQANIADNISIDIKKTDLPIISDIVNQLNSRMNEFGIPKFKNFGAPRSKQAHASWDELSNSINFNLAKLKRKDSIWKNEMAWRQRGIKYNYYADENDVVRSIVDHELGHKLLNMYSMKMDVINTFSKANVTRNGIIETHNILGYYSSTQEHEYFAEAFSMFMGAERSKLGKETGAMMERLMIKVNAKMGNANKSIPVPEIVTSKVPKRIKTDSEKIEIQKRWNERKLYNKITNTENEIRLNKKFETGVVLDRNGNVVIDKRGAKYSVEFTDEECAKMKDCIFTHNHPRGWQEPEKSLGRIGNSFSPADMYLAITHNVSEMRAVTPNYTFIMKRPEEGWGIIISKFEKLVNQENNKLRAEFTKRINNDTLSPTMASAVHYHILWKRVAEKMKWSYTKAKTR